MQIQLRQTEIEAALKQYVTKLGVNLQGKSVTIGFTAGRKDSGLSADISIEDIAEFQLDLLPDDDETRPGLSVVPPTVEAAPAAKAEAEEAAALPNTVATVLAEAAVTKAATSSLFG